MAAGCLRTIKPLLACIMLAWCYPAAAAHTTYRCPKATDIKLATNTDNRGHLQCTYSANLDQSDIMLRHIDRDIDKTACPAVPGALSSVIFVTEGIRQGTISCAYGPPDKANVSWAMANLKKQDKNKLTTCRLASTNTPSTSHDTHTSCLEATEHCQLICAKPVSS
jgi:hypothetical protein